MSSGDEKEGEASVGGDEESEGLLTGVEVDELHSRTERLERSVRQHEPCLLILGALALAALFFAMFAFAGMSRNGGLLPGDIDLAHWTTNRRQWARWWDPGVRGEEGRTFWETLHGD